LQERFEACQVSTGDILRNAVADQSPLGKETSEYIKRGALVPDNIIVKLVAERLKQEDCAKGFVLDGFPRTTSQAESQEQMLEKKGLELQNGLSEQVPPVVSVER
jgi:adenylate kinase